MLGVLEGSGYEKSGAGSAAELHFLAETMRRYFADRAAVDGRSGLRESAGGEACSIRLTSRSCAARSIRSTPRRAPQIHSGVTIAPESSETTHYSIVDADGNAVAVTYTLNFGYGSAVTAPGLGFLLNDEMDDFAAKPGEPNGFGLVQGEANAIQPRKTSALFDDATIVTRGGKLELVLGTPGGPTIINSVLQVLVNVVDFGMNVQDAVDFPRIHHQWLPDQLVMERGFSPDTIALLKARGHHVKIVHSHRRNGRDRGARRVARRRRRSTHGRHRQGILGMRHVLSTHLFINHRLTVAQLDKIQHAGIPAVEIFCARQHLDYRDRAQITELGHWFREADLQLHSIHAPMYTDDIWGRSGPHSIISITEPVKGKRLEMVDEIKRVAGNRGDNSIQVCRYSISALRAKNIRSGPWKRLFRRWNRSAFSRGNGVWRCCSKTFRMGFRAASA